MRIVSIVAQATGSPGGESGRRAPRVPFALLVGGLIVGSLVLLLALNTASAANELERHGLAAKNDNLTAELQDLHQRAARSAAPDNLARAAADLGMVPAGNPAFVVIGANGTAVVLGKPKPATQPPVIVPKPKPSTTAPTASPSTLPVTEPPTGTAVPGASPTTTAGRTPTATTTSPGATPRSTPTSTPRPTSTPTPEISLPGGAR